MKPTSDWRSVIKIHPAADLFPMMSPEELRALGEDIKANGVKVPIEIWIDEADEEWLIDGRNRLDALAHLIKRLTRAIGSDAVSGALYPFIEKGAGGKLPKKDRRFQAQPARQS